jgi:hypothetical protein
MQWVVHNKQPRSGIVAFHFRSSNRYFSVASLIHGQKFSKLLNLKLFFGEVNNTE